MTQPDRDKPDPSLTREQRLFVGRKDELKQFDEVLASPKGQAVIVVGQAGMGKTMLVNRMKHRAESHSGFKCGAVRYEVTPTDPPAATMALMLEDAVSAARASKKTILGTDNQWRALFKTVGLIPGAGKAAEALGDLILSLTWDTAKPVRRQFMDRLRFISGKMPANGRAIFVVDPEKYMKDGSADDWRLVVRDLPDKIIFLFAQRPEDALITSSDFLGLPNVGRIPDERLDPLDEGNVDELIDARKTQLPVSTIEAREAVKRYQGHPYAVQAALDLLVDGRPINELPPDPTAERIAETQWKQVCDKHGKEAIALFQGYAVLEVAVPDEVVEAVSGLDSSARKALVANAYLAGLLRDEEDGKRIYHSLLLDHIRGQLSDDDGNAYHRRAVDIYRKRLTADAKPDALAAIRLPEHVLVADGPKAFMVSLADECTGPLLTLGLVDAALSLSHRALNDFVTAGTEDDAIIRGNLGVIYRVRGDLDRAEEMHLRSLAIEEKLGRLEGMAARYGNLGVIYQVRGDLDKAEEMHRKALQIDEQHGFLDEGVGNAYGNLGLIYQTRGDLDKAEEMHRRALAIDERLARLEGMAEQYGNLGLIYLTRGAFEKAEQMHRKSLEIFEKLGALEGMANAYGNLGVIYHTRGDLDKAEEMLRKAQAISEDLDNPQGVGTCCSNLGAIYFDRRDLKRALDMHERSLEINEKLGCLEGVATNCGNLGLVYQACGDLDNAEQKHRKSLEIEEKLGHLEGMAAGYGNLGAIYITRGDMDKAEPVLRRSLSMHEELGKLAGVARDYGNLGRIYSTRGNLKAAREYWTKARDLFEQIGMPHMVEKMQGWLDELGNAEC